MIADLDTIAFFGDAITSYDWTCVIAPDRVGALFTLRAAMSATMCSACWPHITTSTAGRLTILRGLQLTATFSNWHS